MPQIWINGRLIDENEPAISPRDTGLLHAAGVFTTMRAMSGKVFRLADHLRRLRGSCEALFIPFQFTNERLIAAVDELLTANQLSDARLRLTVTRGLAKQDPLHGLHLEPTVLLSAGALEPYPAEFYQRGMTVIALDEQKLNPYDIQAGHKTLNYLSRLSALREANRRGAGEALWFNVHNYLQSGSVSNVFVVKAGVAITPPTPADFLDSAFAQSMPYPRSAVLPGVTRAAILELAEDENIPTRLGALTIDDLLEADEVFLTNSIMGVMPVCRVERRAIANDKPGPITRRLGDRLMAAIETE